MQLKHLPYVGGAAVVCLALLWVAAAWDRQTGTGRMHVVGVADDNVNLLVDGQQITALARGEHHHWELSQGAHEVTIARTSGPPRVHALNIENGDWEMVLPAANQCFVVLDVTEAHYGEGDRPTVLARHFDGEPFGGAAVYYSTRELPGSLHRGLRASLVAEVPCGLAAAPDPELLTAAGY